jgi:hypothetical protein
VPSPSSIDFSQLNLQPAGGTVGQKTQMHLSTTVTLIRGFSSYLILFGNKISRKEAGNAKPARELVKGVGERRRDGKEERGPDMIAW